MNRRLLGWGPGAVLSVRENNKSNGHNHGTPKHNSYREDLNQRITEESKVFHRRIMTDK